MRNEIEKLFDELGKIIKNWIKLENEIWQCLMDLVHGVVCSSCDCIDSCEGRKDATDKAGFAS